MNNQNQTNQTNQQNQSNQQSQQNPVLNYLFYSSRCESSANFIRIIQNKGIFNMFNLVCIDKMTTDQIIGLGIKFTPTVVIRDMSGRNPTSTFEGKVAFEWLDNIIKFREQNLARIVEMNRKKILQSNQQVNRENNILGFVPNENSGISDNFSYTADNLENIAQPKSYMGVFDTQQIITFNEEKNYKLKDKDLDSKLKEYNTKMKEQTKQIENMIEGQLKTTLINKLNNQP